MTVTQVNKHSAGTEEGTLSMQAHICKAKNQTTTDRSDAAQAVLTAIKDLYSQDIITGYKVVEYNVDFRAYDGTNVLDQWSTWLSSQSVQGDGAWLLVHGVANGSNENAAYQPGAWTGSRCATVSTTRATNASQFKTLAIHEVFHTYINEGCDDVQDLIGGGYGDHSLGRDYLRNLNDYRSPMSTGHGEASGAGSCSEYKGLGVGYLREASSCTVEALQSSAQHAAGYVGHN